MATEVRDASGLVLRVGHTSELGQDVLDEARGLLEHVVFKDDFTERDWEHALGGVHAVAWRGDALVGHASLIQRRLIYRGAALRAGYVEAVGVHPAWQRAGVGGRLMDRLEEVIVRAFELGALGATDVGAAFYRKRGWLPWRGPLSALTPDGLKPTPDEAGAIHVFTAARPFDLGASLTADWRDGDVW